MKNQEDKIGADEDDELIIELTDVVEFKTEVNEFDGLDQDMEGLGTLISEISGHAVLPEIALTDPGLPEISTLSISQLDAAVEKAVDKLFREKIEARVMALFEDAVKKEIEKINVLIRKQTDPDR